MRPPIFLLVLCALLALSSLAMSASSVFDKILVSTIRVTGEKDAETPFGTLHGTYVCSGFIVSKNRALTAGHCVGQNMAVDGDEHVRVVKTDDLYDLALLDISTPKPWLSFRAIPVANGQTLIATGYAEGFDRASQFLVHPFLVDYAPSESVPAGLFVQPAYISGMSGGPVTDLSGRVVSMIQDGSDAGWGYGISAPLIKAFLFGVK